MHRDKARWRAQGLVQGVLRRRMHTTMLRRLLWAAALLWASTASALHARPIEVVGSTTVNPVVTRAAEILLSERSLRIRIDTQGGSTGGITALGDGRADLAMSSRPISIRDRKRHPEVDFRPHTIGFDALAVVVSRDVWDAGVRALSAEQLRAIYERRVRNWSALGGPDRRIVFLNKEPGRGTWEVFVRWLYGDADKAPLVSHPEVGSNEELRTKVASTRGAISTLSAAWADGERVFALSIQGADGTRAAPELNAVESGRYPLTRPLLLVTRGEAKSEAAELIDFLLGERGRELVRKAGYLPVRVPVDEVARR